MKKIFRITTCGPDEIVYRDFIYTVEAESEQEAIDKVNNKEVDYDDYMSVEYLQIEETILKELLEDHSMHIVDVEEVHIPSKMDKLIAEFQAASEKANQLLKQIKDEEDRDN
jgi:hypothetical protein